MQAGLHTAESPTQIFRCTVSSQNIRTCSPPFIPPNVPRLCPSVRTTGNFTGVPFACTFLYGTLISQVEATSTSLYAHRNIVHIIKMVILSQEINFLKSIHYCKMELADLMFYGALNMQEYPIYKRIRKEGAVLTKFKMSDKVLVIKTL